MRRLCSPLTASKPSPIASTGTRKVSSETSGGNGARALVNSVRNRNGSSLVLALISSDAPIERREGEQRHQAFQHAHARAGQMVGQLLDKDRADAVQRRSFTPHGDALPRPCPGNAAHRWLRGSLPRSTDR